MATPELLSSLVVSGATTLGAAVVAALGARFAKKQIDDVADKQEAVKADSTRSKVMEIVAGLDLATHNIKTSSGEVNSGEFQRVLSELDRLRREQADQEIASVEVLIQSHQKQALAQASIQFWFSVFAATLGFGLIIGSAIYSFGVSDSSTAVIRSVPGIVIEAVAALFFKQATETRQRATDFYDRLRNDSNKDEAIALASKIEDVTLRSAVQAEIALHLADHKSANLNIGALLGAPSESPKIQPEIPSTKDRRSTRATRGSRLGPSESDPT